MKKIVVIPTYWGRPSTQGWKEGDAVYDHPTPIDKEGTLERTLVSMRILNPADYELAVIVCPTTEDVEDQATAKVENIIKKVNLGIPCFVFTSDILGEISKYFQENESIKQISQILSFYGYPNVRNICLLAAELADAEAAILIDDDEVFELNDFVNRAVEHLREKINGKTINAIAGYYLNRHNTIYDDVEIQPWMTYWDRFTAKARAFDQIIAAEPRLKRTPFAFGGAMVIHQVLFRQVPFDPQITRGEDIDYLINCEMFGHSFYLDNTLSIKHLPEPKEHPEWKRVREDIYRFVYQKAKLSTQVKMPDMTIVSSEDYDPYPGEFLKDDLEEKIFRSNVMLSQKYLLEGNYKDSEEALRNIYIASNDALPSYNAFLGYCHIQEKWSQLMDDLSEAGEFKSGLIEEYRIN
jgi:hypothetical protein